MKIFFDLMEHENIFSVILPLAIGHGLDVDMNILPGV